MVPPWSLLLLAASAAAVRCPDGRTCSEKTLCCELPDGNGYGCCPENEVVSRSLPMITSGVSCSDDKGCPEEYSCVGTSHGRSACCPFVKGTSCQDGHHCCPSGSHCSEDGHYCIPASNLSAVICPDGISECPNGATCCQMADQSWGCCPIPQAKCCSDHLHCCPHASECDIEHGKCTSENGEVPLLKKLPARVKLVNSAFKKVDCSDGSSCPDGTTCCRTEDEHYGCCPFTSAVCCDDFLHCCPSGTTCDVPHKKCVNANFEIPMYSKIPALHEEATVKCDDASSCPGTATCCRMASGDWGCCPYEKAVCCDDHEHCCPSGYTCTEESCQQETVSIPWSKKSPAIRQKSTDIQCDDETSCPDKTTCCQLQSGDWGCCPFEQAVCCSDHLHCCPSGYTCDVASGTCNKPSGALQKATPIQPLSYVWCDATHACYDGQTCCVGAGGTWTCCPYSNGVCCPDRVHCCPYGHVCLFSGAQCSRSGSPRWDLVWEELKPRL